MQAQVSSVIKCSGDCIGFGAVLPLSVFADKLPIQQTKEFWKKKVQGTKETEEQLASALKSSKTAILISERVLNAPPELATPLVAGLAQELKMLAGLKPEVPESKHGQCQLFLHCATAYVDSGERAHDLGAVPVTAASSSSSVCMLCCCQFCILNSTEFGWLLPLLSLDMFPSSRYIQ